MKTLVWSWVNLGSKQTLLKMLSGQNIITWRSLTLWRVSLYSSTFDLSCFISLSLVIKSALTKAQIGRLHDHANHPSTVIFPNINGHLSKHQPHVSLLYLTAKITLLWYGSCSSLTSWQPISFVIGVLPCLMTANMVHTLIVLYISGTRLYNAEYLTKHMVIYN